jgi:HK97 family phage major capsid protein
METAELNSISQSVKDFTDATKGTLGEQSARLLAIEQKMTAPRGGPGGDDGSNSSIGQQVADSPQFKAMLQNNSRRSGAIPITGLKTTIVNAAGLNQPLVPGMRVPGIIPPGQRRLTIRDLLPQLPTRSNMVEFTKETSSTNNAGIQATEGDVKGESAMAFTLSYQPVRTLAHWIPASKQVMEDSDSLAAYINSRLLYMLKVREEDQLLNGSGVGSELSGLIANSTPYDTSYSNPATDTFIDVLEHAITQVQQNSDFEASGIILNSLDFAALRLIKNSQGNYIYGDPASAAVPQLWGLPVVATKAMARNQFLVGAFQMAATIWDRSDATIELSREHSDFWVRNLLAILVEERLCLTVYRSDALLYGGLPFGS